MELRAYKDGEALASWLQGLPGRCDAGRKELLWLYFFEQWFPKLAKLLDHLGASRR